MLREKSKRLCRGLALRGSGGLDLSGKREKKSRFSEFNFTHAKFAFYSKTNQTSMILSNLMFKKYEFGAG